MIHASSSLAVPSIMFAGVHASEHLFMFLSVDDGARIQHVIARKIADVTPSASVPGEGLGSHVSCTQLH